MTTRKMTVCSEWQVSGGSLNQQLETNNQQPEKGRTK